ncbi:hypothetical protein SmJEL517_g05250 [Synchytrium microbalum]|uniref:4-coumarate--CoA ligase n=1 Tax=Synchytrium microbalum TaxID=1806994 RepID=A0A507BWC5_9FUNG|nr:uncharacterized protein SmJEL517_g05250 [Synchytrium microbalum]TPX31421.1 hypothetical protein SmJEL517_g05250 [Synchytrium microbalum]
MNDSGSRRVLAIANQLSSNGSTRMINHVDYTPSKNPNAIKTPDFLPISRTELNPLSYLVRTCNVYPTKIAIKDSHGSYTYQQFGERVRRLASLVLSMGLKKGDVVGFIASNITPTFEAQFAIPLAGGILTCINTRLNADEVEYIVDFAKIRFLFVDGEFLSLTKNAKKLGVESVIRIDDSGNVKTDEYEQLLAQSKVLPFNAYPNYYVPSENDVMQICWTSGTTGRPKGVEYTYRGVYLNSISEAIESGFVMGKVTYLWILPLFHAAGWCFPYSTVAYAATSVMLRKVDYNEIWKRFIEDGVTHYTGAPTVQIHIIAHPMATRLKHPVTVMVGGAPASSTLIEGMRKFNLYPVHVYGLTETYGPCVASAFQDEWAGKSIPDQAILMGRQGQNYLMSDEMKVVDSEMVETPWDGKTQGEVVFRGNLVMKGYMGRRADTEEAMANGWFHSGDIATRHPDGYLELQDRKKDIIISGGENISTIEVESVVASHPAVLEVSVVATPDDSWGERPLAYVVLKHGMTATSDEIVAYTKDRLAGFKRPKGVKFLTELPKTSTGKIQKYVLRDLEWKGKTKRIN